MRPTADIDGCRAAQAAVLRAVEGLDDEAVRRPSLLPGWTVAHVIGHLVGNADSVTRRLQGVLEDRAVDQYPGGEKGRADEIDRLALLPAAELVAAVRRSNAAVDAILDEVPDDAWDRLSRAVGGALRPATAVVFSRWRESVVHHTDLGLGYLPSQWPPLMVERWLPDALAGLAHRADPAELLAWAVGRGPVPDLAPWG